MRTVGAVITLLIVIPLAWTFLGGDDYITPKDVTRCSDPGGYCETFPSKLDIDPAPPVVGLTYDWSIANTTMTIVTNSGEVQINWQAVEAAAKGSSHDFYAAWAQVMIAVRDGTWKPLP